ncbi:ketopantoate reductase family protein [Metabacillus sp. 84]|uniref:ketopantoate reductase family protein n=1 Tax=Metabacillus sp. 84 TaxID=3404705 RepID=UPI003CEEC0C8
MRFLVTGAGAVGGYFGGRLSENGQDVTFLVREKRRQQLSESGLVIKSIHGDYHCQPQTITKGDTGTFDVILIAVKAYHFEQAVLDIKPFVHDQTVIIPLLNGMIHIHKLKQHFQEHQLAGGLCFIESHITGDGVIHQTSQAHRIIFGEWNGHFSERIQSIEKAFRGSSLEAAASDSIERDMWEKYLFISVMSGVTALFRQPIGPIRELRESREFLWNFLKEMEALMIASGYPLSADIADRHMTAIDGLDRTMKSSLQRDMENASPTEGEHLHGYLLRLSENQKIPVPCLKIVYGNLELYRSSRQEPF